MIKTYWKNFLENTDRNVNEKCAGVISFGMNVDDCILAVEKILSGAMSCRIYPAEGYRKAMSGEAKVGELSVVADWKGVPCAVIETVQVSTMPVGELTDEICAKEGLQMDLASWREKQMPMVKAEVEELGGEFDDATLVTVEEFKRVYPCA